MNKFEKEDLEFYLPESFKGLSKDYIMGCIFDKKIQENWNPTIGDLMVGHTGNIFVISGMAMLNESIGGTMYYFGGGACDRDGGCVLDSTCCYTANEKGVYIHPIKGVIDRLDHSSIRDFRYIPYPHEKQ